MKFNAKEDLKRLFVVCLASVIMALNIKSFVRTGGLYPGGATGLTLLIQRSAELHCRIRLSMWCSTLYRYTLDSGLSVRSSRYIPV